MSLLLLLKGNGGAATAWSPDDVLPSNVYGDFFRSDLGTPASSGGLLTRWTGLRENADTGARFDLTPYVNAPLVGAYGPSGEDCIRLPTPRFIGNSNDRGGAAGIDIPAPFNANNDGTAGHTVGVCVYTGGGAYVPRGNGGAMENLFNVNWLSSYWRNAYFNQVGLSSNSGEWHSYVYSRAAGATGDFKVWCDGVYVGTSGATTAAQSLDQWYVLGASASFDLCAFFHAYTVLSDSDCEQLGLWLRGGVP